MEPHATMRAVVCTGYGSPEVLQVREVAKPRPRPDEILIRVVAATAHVGDTRIRRADPFPARFVFGLFRPKRNLVLGMELSGVVETAGDAVTDFAEGDEVMAFTGFGLGGNAEFRALPALSRNAGRHGLVVRKPPALSHAEAAAVPAGGLTALQNLRKAGLRGGERLLVNGASGSLGTYAVQLAEHLGAEVTAVCSAANRELVLSLGADRVVDYAAEDFTRAGAHDVVYDAVMTSSAAKCRRILRPGGRFVNNNRLPKLERSDLLELADLIEGGALRPVIDRAYAMSDVVEAHRYVDTGRKKGNVVITVGDADS
ncbi:NAD(P)-dependent alcohol dehydrogenase [Glycomyces tenuis]|uniref:NAD(P)-dependent alcohol dehydrogenase n=1 Tax=Glycomyces tenuis TaxID=58116 RepID=UPI000407ED73|nr:NAD(P)-dependent alcohol dehydrogenase [Glycomyces tenuis]